MDVPLFDIVPWSHGYAHSWALRWMLVSHEVARNRLLALFLPDGTSPWTVEGLALEFRVGRNRADLRFEAIDGVGHRAEVLVETKVNDALRSAQVEAYCETGATVVLYGPGLTGLLHAGAEPVSCERWVTGRQLVTALEGVVKDHGISADVIIVFPHL